MSSAGRVGSSNGCATKPKGRGIGLRSCVVQIRSSSLTGSCVMETAEQQEPYESRGSRTVLGEPGGESPPGHSTHCRPWCCIDTDGSSSSDCCHSRRMSLSSSLSRGATELRLGDFFEAAASAEGRGDAPGPD